MVEIALAADGGYFPGLFVTACSIAEHAAKDVALRFHVLDAGVREEDKRLIERKTLELHPAVAFEWIPVDQKMFEGLPKWNGGYMVYTRLLLPRLLKDVDWCIYCDCDFLWLKDVAELWSERDDQYAMLGTRDGAGWTLDIEGKWFAEHGFAFDRDDYFCAGLTFFNLKKFRDEGIDKKCFEILQLHPPFNDQSVLNITCLGRVKLVPQTWQRFTEVVTQEEVERGVVIHHAGQVPWTKMHWSQQLDDCRLLWHRHHAKYRGISTWRSLRMFYSPARLIAARAITWLFRCPVLTQAMELVAKLGRHPGVYSYQKMRAKRVRG